MKINYPVKDNTISQPFGRYTKEDPIYSKFYATFDYKHCGVDFPTPVGAKVYASFPGIVVRAENHVGMGNVVGIRNGNVVGLYAHLDRMEVRLGDVVEEGVQIGISGETGEACPTPHLHFELRDITKSSLRDMVFDLPFENDLNNFVNTFVYTVNNKNTTKTLKSISKLYFGVDSYWEKIKAFNNFTYSGDFALDAGLQVAIPNYK